MMNRSFRVLFVSLFLIPLSGTAHADATLDKAFRNLAESVKKVLSEEGFPAEIIVGDFSVTPRLKSSGGVEIRRGIEQQLKAVGVTPTDEAEAQLMGEFKLIEVSAPGESSNSAAIEIKVTVLDGDDKKLQDFSIKVFDDPVLQLAGLTTDLPPALQNPERQKLIIDQAKNPETTIKGSAVHASSISPFGVELLVQNGDRLASRTPTLLARQRAFVDLHQGEEYVVRLHNGASFEAAATVLIDGVDMFVDAQDVPKDSRLIIAPGTTADVPGWYFTNRKSKAFEIGGFEESVAGRVGSSTSVGSVTVQFRACWDPSSSPPSNEPAGTPKGGKATKQGRDLEKDYEQVIRDFGQVRTTITVRYDR